MATWLRAAALTLTLAVVAACTPSTVTSPTPSASSVQPTYLCSGAPGTSPAPCDKAKYDEQQKAKALEDEAKGVYERYWKEYMRLTEAGGTTEATQELRATVSDSFLPTIVALLKFQKDNSVVPQTLKHSLTLTISTTDTVADSLVTVVGCEDTRGSVFVNPAGKVFGNGSLSLETRFFKREAGQLKMFAGRGKEVTQC